MKRLLTSCCAALILGVLPGCSRDSVPPPLGPLTVKDDHGAILLSVGPLKDGKLGEPMDPQGSIYSGNVQTSYHADTGGIHLYAGRLGDEDLLFGAAYNIEESLSSVATDLQLITVGGQSAVGLKCTHKGEEDITTYAVVIFHTATGNAWFELTADTAHFDKVWATVTSSMKVAKTVPLKAGTSLRAFTHDTKKYATCKAP
jgi:hypothetical protein